MLEQLIALVNNDDVIIGYEEKYVAHRRGLLHRAFSIIVVNSRKELLLQRRALGKYHSAGLWTNTCCSHLPKGLEMELYAHQRLSEEMGIDCDLRFVKTFHYKIDFQDGMIENEIDHIFLGVCDATPEPNPDEVCEWKWVTLEAVCRDVRANPEIYTYWFRYIIENHLEVLGEIG